MATVVTHLCVKRKLSEFSTTLQTNLNADTAGVDCDNLVAVIPRITGSHVEIIYIYKV